MKFTKEESYISEDDFIETVQEVQEDKETLLNSLIVHEIGNSISAIQSDIQIDYQWISRLHNLIENDPGNLEKHKTILEKLKGVDAYSHIIEQAKEYLDTLEDNRLRTMNLAVAVEKCLRFHNNLFIRNDIKVQFDQKTSDMEIPGGGILIFSNILRNAVDAIITNRTQGKKEYTGVIRIEIFDKGEKGYITFQDNGSPIVSRTGVPLAVKEWNVIFETSFSTKTKEKGYSGLGLAVSRKFATKLGWKLYVDNKTDEGFSKRFVLEIIWGQLH